MRATLAGFVVFSLSVAAWSPSAFAARSGTVDVDQVELFEGPGNRYKLIEKLPRGTPVAASNFPTDGYFKVRTGSGAVGWIAADVLVLSNASQEDEPAVASSPVSAAGFRNAKPKKRVRFKGLGGVTLFNVSEINDLFGFDAMKQGVNIGGEVGFILTNDLAMVVRLERIVKYVVGRDQVTLKTFQLDLLSTPMMIGLDLTLTQEGRLSSRFGVMGGLGLQTELIAMDLSDPAPNVTRMSTHAFTGMARLDVSYNITKSIAIFAEGGYRVLKTLQIVPGAAVNGSQIFQQNGEYVPVSLDLSGPVISAGLSILL